MSTADPNISGNVVVITGASSGPGEATARYLARAVAFAIGRPEDVDIDEILFRSTGHQL